MYGRTTRITIGRYCDSASWINSRRLSVGVSLRQLEKHAFYELTWKEVEVTAGFSILEHSDAFFLITLDICSKHGKLQKAVAQLFATRQLGKRQYDQSCC